MVSTGYTLQAKNISKSFPGVQALEAVQLNVNKGTVHALIGENGAGKSTLMKILMGLLEPDSGELYLQGRNVNFSSPHGALKAGISMIHQELMPFLNLSVAENIFMGKESAGRLPFWIDKQQMILQADLILKKIGLNIHAGQPMSQLNVAQMQLVEIAKAISNNACIIIMDEPTTAISDKEVEVLFNLIRELRQQGLAIIYISHKMDEILKIADVITIMRDGKYIGTYQKQELDRDKLISLIVGRDLNSIFERHKIETGITLLSVRDLAGPKFRNITFDVKSGEIVGLAGLMGSGRTEIVNSIFGIEKLSSGEIFIKNSKVTIKSPADALKKGIGLVSEDRKNFGLILKSSVTRNITLSALRKISNWSFIRTKKENETAAAQIKKFQIKASSPKQVLKNLSGGNQQKVVIAKVLLCNPDIIILDEPTKGVDIGTKAEIYRIIFQLASEGKGILLISSELPEILGMSDRILVIRDGTLKAELKKPEATQELIMKYAML